jgi:regulator of cell morphogenesis and NO signaling
VTYKPADKMSILTASHYKILLVLCRFGISLGFGEKSIDEVCKENSVDTATFLSIVDLILDKNNKLDVNEIQCDANEIVIYLQNSHSFFLDFRFKTIRQELSQILKNDNNELSKAVLFYFDEYITEVRKHMEYEEKTFFPYIWQLLENKRNKTYSVETFVKQHNQIEERLKEFKWLIIKYYPIKSSNELNSVLFDIFSCEEDLLSHNLIEDRLLVPLVRKIEKELKK